MYGLKAETIDQIKGICNHYPQIEEVILYGSRAMGTFKNGSDVDLTLKGHDLNLDVLTHLSNDLDDTSLPYMFDLSIYDHIQNSDLLDHIHRVGTVIYRREAVKKSGRA